MVNDHHHPYPALQVRWQIRDAAGAPLLEQDISCSAAANSLTKIADVSWTIPPTPGACYRVTFTLTDPTGTLSTNEYRLAVQGPTPITPWRGWLLSSVSPSHANGRFHEHDYRSPQRSNARSTTLAGAEMM